MQRKKLESATYLSESTMTDLRHNYRKVAPTLIACSANGSGSPQMIVSMSGRS